ncbi:hypothetical protein NLG97_g6943 [Lecanicillium saksenae]|uniref:Uncharacterized protein n=1 Tax=Lecanicillium saksenae TaxID=468837 RepID=A0ACC1QRE7_9HYPO|nr:hypothetical protein NLG97_g6943 [Lecanicillium saksenae]
MCTPETILLSTEFLVHAGSARLLAGRKLAAAAAVAHKVGNGVLAGHAGAGVGVDAAGAPAMLHGGRVVDAVVGGIALGPAAVIERVPEAEPVANLVRRRLPVESDAGAHHAAVDAPVRLGAGEVAPPVPLVVVHVEEVERPVVALAHGPLHAILVLAVRPIGVGAVVDAAVLKLEAHAGESTVDIVDDFLGVGFLYISSLERERKREEDEICITYAEIAVLRVCRLGNNVEVRGNDNIGRNSLTGASFDGSGFLFLHLVGSGEKFCADLSRATFLVACQGGTKAGSRHGDGQEEILEDHDSEKQGLV